MASLPLMDALPQWRRNCVDLQIRIVFEVDCLAAHMHRTKYARICLIVLRGIVGQLPNDVVSEVLWLLHGHSIWHAYPRVPPSLCCALPLVPDDPGHSLSLLVQHRKSGTLVVNFERQTVYRLAALQRVQSLLLERLCAMREVASDIADDAVDDWVETVAVMDIPPSTA